MQKETQFEVAIIGSGIVGTSLGAILARQGIRVIIFEAKSHPRFAIGESMILETSEMMRALADFYDVPELAWFSSENFLAHAGTTHGVKRHFGFFHHTPGQEHNPKRTLQAVIPKEPHGHELHLYRQDTDFFLMATAIKYGATVLQNTPVDDVAFLENGVKIVTKSGETYATGYIVDAAGFRSILAQKFGLRHRNLQTHSRAIFTHMIDVGLPPSDNGKSAEYNLPFRMEEGTLHHVFDGGWLWVIPFNNHLESTNPLVSVGLLLDPRIHPQNNDLSPEDEFFTFIERFPTVAKQFKNAKAVRNWIRVPRIQYGSKRVVGDRWAMVGGAAGFIDPLYSKGMYCSLTGVAVLADLLLDARETGDFSAETFIPLETITQNYLCAFDRLVANSYRAFQHPDLWQTYAAQWLLGAYTEYVKLNAIRAMSAGDRKKWLADLLNLHLVGGGFPEFDTVSDQIDTLLEQVDPTNEDDVTQTIAAAHAIYDQTPWMPNAFRVLLDGHTHLPKKKLRLSLLKRNKGFMGTGAYRQHFFGEHSITELARAFVEEKIRFARFNLTRQRKKTRRKQLQAS